MNKEALSYIDLLIERYPKFESQKQNITAAIALLISTYKNGNKVLVCGNGGSASDSEHIVGELMKGFVKKRSLPEDICKKINDESISSYLQGALPTIALTVENALQTAFANDQNPLLSFAQQVYGLGKKGDTLICISTSGNSKNCVYAAKVAKAMELNVISLTGMNHSKLADISDVVIQAPEKETYKIQECHLPIYHAICLALESEFFGE